MPQRGEERKDNGVAPLFVRDAIVGEQELTELAVEAGWKRDQNGFARHSGAGLRCLLPGRDGGGKLAVATSSVIAIRRVMVWFNHKTSFARIQSWLSSTSVASRRSISQPRREH